MDSRHPQEHRLADTHHSAGSEEPLREFTANQTRKKYSSQEPEDVYFISYGAVQRSGSSDVLVFNFRQLLNIGLGMGIRF